MYRFKYPSQIGIAVTNRCNFSCIHCINASSTQSQEEIPVETVKHIIDYMYAHGIICLDISGGEPLLYSGLEEILSYGHTKSLTMSIATNGYLLTSKVVGMFKKFNVSVRVSYDGYDEQTFSEIRGEGHYKRVLQNINNAIDNGLGISLVTVIHHGNVDRIQHYIKSAASIRIKQLRIMPYVPAGRGKESTLKMVTPLQWKYILQNFEHWETEYDVKVALDTPLMAITHKLTCPCIVGKFYLDIKSNGDAIPCALLDIPIGNIFSNSIDEIWNNRIMQELNNVSLLNKECQDCEYLHACAGGCRGMAYLMKGSYLCKDPLCWLGSQDK